MLGSSTCEVVAGAGAPLSDRAEIARVKRDLPSTFV